MALDLNVSPYFDDSENAIAKKYTKLLFKPGYAVQARELTQLQSILQDQVGKFGNHIFKNGAVVAGCEFELDPERPYVKVLDLDASGLTVSNIANYAGTTVVGQTSGIKAKIISGYPGAEATAPYLNTLYLRYLTGDGSSSQTYFDPGETLVVTEAEDVTLIGDSFVLSSDTSAGIDCYLGLGSFLTVRDGIVFLEGKFLEFNKQVLPLEFYSSVPDVKVGFELKEIIVNSEEDQTLLDPAQGTFNFAAPGADRYTAYPTLVKYRRSETPSEDFELYVDIRYGTVYTSQTEDKVYATLLKNIAKRTYDESGNYTVKPFPIRIREFLDDGTNGGLKAYNANDPGMGGNDRMLAVQIEPGRAYVKGYPVSNGVTETLIIPKGLDTKIIEEIPIATSYGNYVRVNDFCGQWDVAGGSTISLRDDQSDAVSSGTYSATAPGGSEIGTAKVRYVQLESGTPGTASAIYRVYLYDMRYNSGSSFENVQAIYHNSTADGHGDLVLENVNPLVNGVVPVLKETKFNRLLFRLPAKATKTLKPGLSQDNSFDYTKQFSSTISTSTNQITISVSGSETFPLSVGTLTDSEIQDNIVAVTTQAANINGSPVSAGTVLDLTASGASVTNTGTQLTIQLPGSSTIAATVQILVKVHVANADPVTKVLKEDAHVVFDTNASGNTTGTYSLGASDGWQLKNVYIGDYTETAVDIVALDDDVADEFTFDTGQRDNFYANARIVKKAGSSLNLTDKKLVVVFDYFEHNGSPVTNYNFYNVDSYPVDDETGAAGTIKTWEIPVYTSQVTGATYDLRDTLDFRPRFDNSIVFTTSASSAEASNLNPSASVTPSGPQGGAVITPVPTEQFITDLEYYMGRKDRLVVDEEGNFSTVYGVPSLSPVEALEPENVMSLALITIPPYPSLAPNVAKTLGKPELGVKYKLVDNRRYTMRDIGVLEQRINRLEYYSSLNLLEKAAKDLVIPSAVDPSLNRFKNGILVDAFTGHNIANIKSSEHHCSIDPDKKELRPFFFLENVDLQYNASNSTNMQRTGDLLTLPYISMPYVTNPFATKPRNCVGELLFNYVGDMQLDPPVDNWTDTSVLPDVAANFDGNYDAWENMANAWGTQWGDWQDLGTGKVIATETQDIVTAVHGGGDTGFQTDAQLVTSTIEQRQTRQGVTISVTPEDQKVRTGARVTNTSIVPFMRSITVTFKAERLKPNTRVYPFFDGTAVAAHCRPLSISQAWNLTLESPAQASQYASGDWDDALVTDDDGRVMGQFRIPQGQFRVGEKIFRLADDHKNRKGFVSTSCTQTFSANGLSQNVQDTVISTRVPKVSVNTVNDERSTYDTQTSVNRLEGRTVGIQTNIINNTYNTYNDYNTYVTETTVNNTTIVEQVPVQPDPEPEDPIVIYVPVTPEPEPDTWGITTTPVVTTTPTPVVTTTTTTAAPITTTTTSTTTTAAPITTTTTSTTTTAAPITTTTTPAPFFPRLDCVQALTASEDWWMSQTAQQLIESPNWWQGCESVFMAPMDPIAQTFMVERMPFGMYTTSIDVFFRTKSEVSPITLQLREVQNGYPSVNVLPFGEVTLQPSQVNVDAESGTAKTTFTFPSPVYLQNNTEYCYVLLPAGNDPDYEVWVSELGENQVNTTTRVSEQPAVGMLFTSANNRSWTAHQAEDMKFSLNRAEFALNTVGLVELEVQDIDYLRFDQFTGGNFDVGEALHSFKIALSDGGSGYTDGTHTLSLSGGGATTNATVNVTVSAGVVTSVTVATPGRGYTSDPNIDFSSIAGGVDAAATVRLNKGYVQSYDTLYNVAKLFVEKGAFTTGDIVGNGSAYGECIEVEDKIINSITTNIGNITHTPCRMIWSYCATTNTGTEVEAGTDFINFTADKPEELTFDASIRSFSNEYNNLGAEKSFKVRVGMTTSSSTVSPVIDLKKCSMVATANDINNDATDEDTNFGLAGSKYVSRRVVLDDGQEAEDLRVYLTNSLPSGTSVNVYGKFQHEADPEAFEDKEWVLLDTTPPAELLPTGYAEYTYDIPDANLNPDGIYEYTDNGVTYRGYKIFAIKIVMLSTKQCVVPKVRELRAIALQV